MATNLEIENLSRSVEVGTGGGASMSEASVIREMRNNGMQVPEAGGAEPSTNGDTKTFMGVLKDSMETVNLHQHQADHAIKEMIAGRSKNIHETMLTVERADTSLKMMMQVRNKILEAYREVMRMQV